MSADLASPKPSGPSHPRPSHPSPSKPKPPTPTKAADDALFAAVDEVLADWSFELPRRKPWASFDLKGLS